MTKRKTYLLISLLLGISVRAGFLVTPHIDSDQAVFGLQGIHILKGEFPIFSWGYAYMGTFQSYLDAVAFFIFGSSRLILNAVTTFLSIFIILIMYLLGKEIFGEKGGLFSAAFTAIGPAYLTFHGAWARHGYIETLLFGALILLVSIRLVGDSTYRSGIDNRRDRSRLFIILGLISGLALWTNFLVIVYLPACGLYLFLKDRNFFRKETLLAIPSFLLGSLPFWIYNLNHSFASFWILKTGKKEPFIKNLEDLFLIGIPEIIGANSVKDTMLYGLFFIIIGIFIFSVILLIFFGIKDIIGPSPSALSPKGRGWGEGDGIGIILLFFLSFFIIYFASTLGSSIAGTRRYLLPLYSGIPILITLFLLKIGNYSKRLMYVGVVLVLFINIYGHIKDYVFLNDRELKKYITERRLERNLFDFMKGKEVFHAYVFDYWLGPRLTFDSKEEIIFALPGNTERYPKYKAILNASNNFAYVFNRFDSKSVKIFDDNLKAMGISYKREDIKDFNIFYSFSYTGLKELPRHNWKAVSFRGDEGVFNAFDGDIESAWFSGEPKRDGIWFRFDLGGIYRIAGLSILPGLVPEGNMGGYSIEVSKDGRSWTLVGRMDKDLLPSLYWYNGGPRFDHPRIKVSFSPVDVRYIKITQHGEDKYYNWTIAELFVYSPIKEETSRYSNLIDEGRNLEARGEYRGAMKKYLNVIKSYGDSEAGYYRLMALMQDLSIPLGPIDSKAEAFENAGLIEKAIENYEHEYRRLYSSGSYSSVLLNRLINLYGKLGDKEKSHYFRERLKEEFSPSEKRSINFGGIIEFLGYDIKYGSTLEIVYYWKVTGDVKKDWKVFVHFVGPDGSVSFQNDHLLFSGDKPSSQWVRGEVYKERFKIEVPEGLKPGNYEIRVGLWDPKTGMRLKVKSSIFKKIDEVSIGVFKATL